MKVWVLQDHIEDSEDVYSYRVFVSKAAALTAAVEDNTPARKDREGIEWLYDAPFVYAGCNERLNEVYYANKNDVWRCIREVEVEG